MVDLIVAAAILGYLIVGAVASGICFREEYVTHKAGDDPFPFLTVIAWPLAAVLGVGFALYQLAKWVASLVYSPIDNKSTIEYGHDHDSLVDSH